jgi:hypothetical protein
MWISWWNENWQGKLMHSEKTCSSATMSTTDHRWPDLGLKLGCCAGKSMANSLSHGMARNFILTLFGGGYFMMLSVPTLYTVKWYDDKWWFGNKWPWTNWGIILEFAWGTEENHKNLRWNNHCPSQNSNWAPHAYESRLLLLHQLNNFI